MFSRVIDRERHARVIASYGISGGPRDCVAAVEHFVAIFQVDCGPNLDLHPFRYFIRARC